MCLLWVFSPPFVFKAHYSYIISSQCFENYSVFSIIHKQTEFIFTSFHSADKCQEKRVKHSLKHRRYHPRQNKLRLGGGMCAAGVMIT